jgi:fructose-1,6-bisphosphatase/inositol monophosphatase family enzyme
MSAAASVFTSLRPPERKNGAGREVLRPRTQRRFFRSPQTPVQHDQAGAVNVVSSTAMERDLRFWDFAGGVTAGALAGGAAAALARRGFSGNRDLAASFARAGAFWIVGGLVWLALARRR